MLWEPVVEGTSLSGQRHLPGRAHSVSDIMSITLRIPYPPRNLPGPTLLRGHHPLPSLRPRPNPPCHVLGETSFRVRRRTRPPPLPYPVSSLRIYSGQSLRQHVLRHPPRLSRWTYSVVRVSTEDLLPYQFVVGSCKSLLLGSLGSSVLDPGLLRHRTLSTWSDPVYRVPNHRQSQSMSDPGYRPGEETSRGNWRCHFPCRSVRPPGLQSW